ncbi:DEAD/DEAH box helicase [Kocuria rhizophila]|uniref:Helicase ATP-binding domain-containing protein n=1 Tax=Kocuria rhizophila (strain ATCC 9341 / DSM 348 / NBRC 103217 / DC2201) TaxID=378753 RepID=B2GI69_KOCRD|nr:DEAD/DEAH box helicase [Kocuria rhizophila]BAG29661.1 hypothetical protein KRH_13140 [Kocuria rhizophila DC2201]VEH75063.1 Superfamily II helicase [Kocuria rhizophila]
MVNFEEMLASEADGVPTEPRELYASLSKSSGYGRLWDVQGQVLSRWYEHKNKKDIVIKVNTGGGKTILGLLILQSYMNQGDGPGLYVVPNKQLAKQVAEDAQNLGIQTTSNVDSSQYLAGEAIGIINIYELINGRTKFSDNRQSRPPVPIGSVVIDDAHAALSTTRTQLSFTIKRNSGNGAYDKLLQLFSNSLSEQSRNGYLDLLEERRGQPMRVPFWEWRKKFSDALSILREISKEDGELYWSWPALAETLQYCRVVFSEKEVCITPYCPPIDHVSSFVKANHRVFLTATLADASILVTDFDADPRSVENCITPILAGDIGERMILVPQEINPSLRVDKLRMRIARFAEQYNMVVIVPSEKSARAWNGLNGKIAVGDEVDAVVSELRSGQHIGLVVIVNRYDGIDLPDDACRILVLDGLPEAFSPDDQLSASLEKNSGSVTNQQVQRIEQGMGRGVRSNEDHCVVFLLGTRLAQLTADPSSLQKFSPATRAQLKLSRQVAAKIENVPLEKIMQTAEQALMRDPGWVKLAANKLRNIQPESESVSPVAIAKRRSFNSLQSGDEQTAVQIVAEAVEKVSDDTNVGILLELQATYADLHDPTMGQQLLRQARAKNPRVTRPLGGAPYVALESPGIQTNNCSERLLRRFNNKNSFLLEVENISDDLVFDEDRVQQFEEALYRLGSVIGLGSQRPEFDIGSGPDNLWALGDQKYWVIEAKSGAKSVAIGKRDMGQLAESMMWFQARYDPQAIATPVMVHPANMIYSDATAVPEMRIINKRKLSELVKAFREFGRALSQANWEDLEEVNRLLHGHGLQASDLEKYTVPQKGVKNS